MTKFYCLVAFASGDMGSMCIAIVCKPDCDVMNFEVKSFENEKSF